MNIKLNKKGWLPVLVCLVLLSSCGLKSGYFEKQVPIPGAKWSSTFMPEFKVELNDTTAIYNYYFLIRHDESYPNSNLWFKMKVKAPGSKTFEDSKRIEVELANEAGAWQGIGMGGIWEHKFQINPKFLPPLTKPGLYEIKIEQLMRDNPLPSVLNVGLMIEKR